jgi:hypothetical protein
MKKNTRLIKLIKVLSLVFACLSLFIAIMLNGILVHYPEPLIADFERASENVKVMWIGSLFLPLPIFCLVFGIVFTIKKYRVISNIIVGTLMTLLLGYISITSFFHEEYDTSNTYWAELNDVIDIDLPDDMTFLSVKHKKESDYKDDKYFVSLEGVARFSSMESLNSYIASLSDKWKPSLSSMMVPTKYYEKAISEESSNRFDRYLIYSFDDNMYNPQNTSVGNRYVCIALLRGKNGMYLIDYSAK